MFKLDTTFMDQMKKEPKYRWFKPILAAVLALVLLNLYSLIALLTQDVINALVFGKKLGSPDLTPNIDPNDYLQVDMTNPVDLFFYLLPFALIILVIHQGMKITKLGGKATLESTARRLRLDRFVAFLPLLFVLFFGEGIVEDLIRVYVLHEPLGAFRFPFASIIVTLILVPLQCMAEEYMLRGFMMQTLKAWIPVVAVAYVGQAVLFMAGHGYDLGGNFCTLVSGLLMGYAVIRTGGLEASMCMHIANNVSSFIFSLLFVGNETKVQTPLSAVILDLVITAASFAIVMTISKKKGYLVENQVAPVEEVPAEETLTQEDAQ